MLGWKKSRIVLKIGDYQHCCCQYGQKDEDHCAMLKYRWLQRSKWRKQRRKQKRGTKRVDEWRMTIEFETKEQKQQ